MKFEKCENGSVVFRVKGDCSALFQDDDTGLFVSKLTDGGPAMIAGLRVGDKLLRVNKTDVVNVRHQACFFILYSCLGNFKYIKNKQCFTLLFSIIKIA